MKRRPVEQLVYEYMIPRPKHSDPPNFPSILNQYLVIEVRQEVLSFYGHINTQEARYPGLDYCHPVHRIRLSRWPWHRRLFRAFDALQLTSAEVAGLTHWEGTKWAKERYEKEQGITIRDTASDGLPDWREPGSRWRAAATRQAAFPDSLQGLSTPVHDTLSVGQQQHVIQTRGLSYMELGGRVDEEDEDGDSDEDGEEAEEDDADEDDEDEDEGEDDDADDDEDNEDDEDGEDGEDDEDDEDDEEDEESDMEIQSIGLQLNERLLERVAAHNAGDTSQPLDEDWEQWLKNAIETGGLSLVADHIDRLTAAPTAASIPEDSIPEDSTPEDSTDSGPPSRRHWPSGPDGWNNVPVFFRDVVSDTFYTEVDAAFDSPPLQEAAPSAPSVAPRRTYSHLRLPASERSRSGSSGAAF